MSTVSSIVPVMTMTPPDGKLLYVNPYTDELSNIDVQGAICSSGVVNDRAYPPMYDVREKATIDERGNLQITHGYLRADWDGVHDSAQGLVYDRSYPPTYGVSDLSAEYQWPDVETARMNYIANPTDTSTEPSDLKNTKTNIRKIKPDINSELKRI